MILSSRLKKFLVGAIIIVTILVYSTPLFSHEAGQALFLRKGYYLILALTALWIFQLILCFENRKPDIRQFFRENAFGFGLCFLLCAIIFICSPPYFRVLPDETKLLSVSKAMSYGRNIDNIATGLWFGQSFHPLSGEIPVRPLLFPFLISIMHAFTGYRAENIFVLNFLVLFSGLALIFLQIRKYTGSQAWGVVGVFLVLGQPIVVQTAASGGFDLLAAVFLAVVLINAGWLMKAPEASRFELLWLNLLMLANTRYESVIFFPLVLGMMWSLGYIKRVLFTGRNGFLYYLTPLFLFLLYYPRAFVKDGLGQAAYGAPAFSMAYFLTNLKTFFYAFFDLTSHYPYAGLINIIGVLALIFFTCHRPSDGSKSLKPTRHLILMAAVCISALLLVHLLYYWGRAGHPSTSRLFLVYAVTLSLLAVSLFYNTDTLKKRPIVVLLLAVTLFIIHRPMLIGDRFTLEQKVPLEHRVARQFFDQESKKGRDYIIISRYPELFSVFNYGSVDFKNKVILAKAASDLRIHAVRDIFVVQSISYKTFEPGPDQSLGADFQLKIVVESLIDDEYFIRISKVVLR